MKRISSLRLALTVGTAALIMVGRPLGMSIFTVWALGLALLVFGGAPFHRGALRGLEERVIRADMLVSVGAVAAFLYSTAAVYFTEVLPEGLRGHHLGTLASLLSASVAGRWLEDRLLMRGGDALGKLLRRLPRTARVLRGRTESMLPCSEISVGETVLVRPGEQIPFDGVIREGSSRVDESVWTGSDVPVEKRAGCRVFGGSQNKEGPLTIEVVRVGGDMGLARLLEEVLEGIVAKERGEDSTDRLARAYLPAAVIVAAATAVLWAWRGPEPRLIHAFAGMSLVLAAACPWTLLIGTPLAVGAAMRKGLRQGVRLRNPAMLARLRMPSVVVLNRKGVLTLGKPQVETVLLCGKLGEEELLSWAAAAESRSNHFFARALRHRVREATPEPESVDIFPGQGVRAEVRGRRVMVGSLSWLAGHGIEPDAKTRRGLETETRVLAGVALDGALAGVILFSETYLEDTPEDVRRLEKMGINVVLASGDREPAVRLAADKAGIAKIFPEALQEEKLAIIRELRGAGGVAAMVGDSVQDVAALSRADLGVALAPLPAEAGQRGRRALGAGIDLAAESADIVLDRRDLSSLAAGIRLSVQLRRSVRENLAWAVLIHAALLPLAGGVLFLTTGMGLRFIHIAAAAGTSGVLILAGTIRRFTS